MSIGISKKRSLYRKYEDEKSQYSTQQGNTVGGYAVVDGEYITQHAKVSAIEEKTKATQM